MGEGGGTGWDGEKMQTIVTEYKLINQLIIIITMLIKALAPIKRVVKYLFSCGSFV